MGQADFVALTARETLEAISHAQAQGIARGRTCDFIILAAGKKAKADTIATFNAHDFATMASDKLVVEVPRGA